jgi:probable phosphoglycerate mutase
MVTCWLKMLAILADGRGEAWVSSLRGPSDSSGRPILGGHYSRHYRRGVELILVRHGQPDWAPGRIASNNPHLTELGARQAELVAQAARQWGQVDEIWMSPLNRARETAAPIADVLRLEPQLHEWTEEIGNPPDWEGSPIDLIEDAWMKANLRTMDEMWQGMPGGESFRDFHHRVVGGLENALGERAIKRLEDGHPHLWQVADERRIVVVAHGGTNAVITGALLGLEPTPWEWDRFESPHTGVAKMATLHIAHGSAFSLKVFGDITHLDPAMVTR